MYGKVLSRAHVSPYLEALRDEDIQVGLGQHFAQCIAGEVCSSHSGDNLATHETD